MRNRPLEYILTAILLVGPASTLAQRPQPAGGGRMVWCFASAARHWRRLLGVLFVAVALASVAPAHAEEDRAAAIVEIVRGAIAKYDLRAVIVRVTIDGQVVITQAFGESIAGVPASTDMHFRNGNIAFAYVTTLLLQLAEEKQVSLDDKLSKWIADLPNADRITLRMLANMTSGYADYVRDEQMVKDIYADPFRQWTPQELISIGVNKPLLFEPGTNFGYSHTGYVILGEVIERVTGKPLAEAMRDRIFIPLGLRGTAAPATAEITPPVLHAFTSERRAALGIAPSTRFYEESTYWSPSWTTAPGAILTTDIYDVITSAVAVGTGSLLSPESASGAGRSATCGLWIANAGVPLVPQDRPGAELRSRRLPARILDRPGPASRRLLGGRGIPAVEKDRDRRGGDIWRKEFRRRRRLRGEHRPRTL